MFQLIRSLLTACPQLHMPQRIAKWIVLVKQVVIPVEIYPTRSGHSSSFFRSEMELRPVFLCIMIIFVFPLRVSTFMQPAINTIGIKTPMDFYLKVRRPSYSGKIIY